MAGLGLLVVGFFPAVASVAALRADRDGDTTEFARAAAVCWFLAAWYVFLQIAFHCGFM